ncbi:ArgE/DapE family deacylase [Fodinibacter luteus]|uniref:ArgE/DapE family deacylase n=1 Tax=Fodinibacter luteus TaxID=552064 RepID=A0ABP8KJ76_9MICO
MATDDLTDDRRDGVTDRPRRDRSGSLEGAGGGAAGARTAADPRSDAGPRTDAGLAADAVALTAADPRSDAGPRSDADLGADAVALTAANPGSDAGPRTDADLGADAVALTAALVAIDSVNPGLVPGAAGEAAIVEHLRTRLRRAGFETHVVTPPGHPDRPSLVAIGPHGAATPVDSTTDGTGTPGPTVVLTGHLDTVGVDGMTAPFEPRTDGDRLEGRGACDMKGGVAAIVVAAEELARRGSPGRVVLALVADEEDASLGTEAVLEALPGLGVRPDVAVITEPTWLALAETLRGYALVEVELEGQAAHSSQPDLGVNAVAHLGRLLTAVEERGREVAEHGGTMLVTLASGGESPFVLARTARALVERRTVPGETSDVALSEVQHLLVHLRLHDDTVRSRARLVLARDSWRLDDTGPAADLGQALETALAVGAAPTAGPVPAAEPASAVPAAEPAPAVGPALSAPERFHAPYWMEAPLWQAAGIPTLVCGPAGGGLHAADEWVDLHQVRRFTVALTDAVSQWVAGRAH